MISAIGFFLSLAIETASIIAYYSINPSVIFFLATSLGTSYYPKAQKMVSGNKSGVLSSFLKVCAFLQLAAIKIISGLYSLMLCFKLSLLTKSLSCCSFAIVAWKVCKVLPDSSTKATPSLVSSNTNDKILIGLPYFNEGLLLSWPLNFTQQALIIYFYPYRVRSSLISFIREGIT